MSEWGFDVSVRPEQKLVPASLCKRVSRTDGGGSKLNILQMLERLRFVWLWDPFFERSVVM